ncbi:MAG: CHAD domain-containing protein [Succiniclasticum sp.]|uniref:CHAD domain-containing protein n=1 Tax=Succiniclasticum sp. TaxID=2775030 RepID=UPI002A919E69|nr:CHAD domain-containing protein [Succiniclasticum sp.]MDY6291451.1 CHAD domain-containing protein [Succiniclasticum sp.]
MALKLCLHGVQIAHPETFSADVAKQLKLTVKQGKLQVKEYGENRSARFRRNKLRGSALLPFKVRTVEGIVLVDSHLYDLRDVIFVFRPGSEKQVMAAVHKLLGRKDRFVVVEPDMRLRLNAMAGKPYPRVSPDTDRLRAMRQYFDWQVYAISWYWHLLYGDTANARLVRQLRVRIRRLRSCFVFFRDGLPEEEATSWQQFFREEADALSNLRELDAAALTCRRMESPDGQAGASTQALLDVFLQLREDEVKKLTARADLNRHTERLAEFLLWLYLLPTRFPKGAIRETARRYAERRIVGWCDKMVSLNQKYPDFSDMDDLHKIRIRVKRFRYVTQTIDLVKLPVDVLRQLKQLQDVLGLLHDDYVNSIWARGIARQRPHEAELQQQIQAFISWQSARSESLLALVAEMWEHFLQMLEENR